MSERRFENPSFPAEQYAKFRPFFEYLGASVAVLFLLTIGAVLFTDAEPLINDLIGGISGYLTNVYTEVLSVAVTILFLDRLAQRREEKRRVKDLQERLVREAGSTVNSIAIRAIEELHNHGWLKGESGVLKGIDLVEANLKNVSLLGANLREANLQESNLREAKLVVADIQRVNLVGTDLTKAKIWGCQLNNADLWQANLAGANLMQVDFANANLAFANLKRAKLEQVQFNHKTVLPDANYFGKDEKGNDIYDKYWTQDTDMTRYTDPNHPDFWQPDWAKDDEE